MKQFLRKTLLALVGGMLVSTSAMADTTIGDKSKGWTEEGASTGAYTLGANKTLTFSFTIDDRNTTASYQGYVAILAKTNANTWGENQYVFLRSMCDYASGGAWNTGALFNVNNYPGNSDAEIETNKNAFLTGASAVMTIKRLDTQVTITTDITKEGITYRHYYVQNLGTTADVYAFLAADAAKLTITSDAITESEAYPTTLGTIVGQENNTTAWWTAFSDYYTIKPNATKTLNFKLYTCKTTNWHTFLAYIINDADRGAAGYTEYYGLRTDNWVLVDDKNATDCNYGDVLGWDWYAYREKLDGATVTVTVTRTDATVKTRAEIYPADGSKTLYVEYSKDCGDGTQDIRLFLTCEGSHIDILPENTSATISAYGWSTFSSDYALDFSKADAGLEAYMITGHTEKVVTMEKVTGTVPAGTGLLLKGTASTAYNIPIVGSSTTDVSSNLLVAGTGASIAAEAGKTKYVLGVNGENAEFQKIVSTNATVAKGKAYLQFNETIAAPALSFDSDITGISATLYDKAEMTNDNAVYDLQGRRVVNGQRSMVNGQSLKKGLYIVNGKKVIIK